MQRHINTVASSCLRVSRVFDGNHCRTRRHRRALECSRRTCEAMTVLVDANLLLHAYDAQPPQPATRPWLRAGISLGRPVRRALVTLLAFVRIDSDPRVFARPPTLAEACAVIESWLAVANVRLLAPRPRTWSYLGIIGSQAQMPAGRGRAPSGTRHGARCGHRHDRPATSGVSRASRRSIRLTMPDRSGRRGLSVSPHGMIGTAPAFAGVLLVVVLAAARGQALGRADRPAAEIVPSIRTCRL